jgi:hypothetical protein
MLWHANQLKDGVTHNRHLSSVRNAPTCSTSEGRRSGSSKNRGRRRADFLAYRYKIRYVWSANARKTFEMLEIVEGFGPTTSDTKQTAVIRGLQPNTLDHERAQRAGPYWIRGARRILYPRRDLEAYLRSLPPGSVSNPEVE